MKRQLLEQKTCHMTHKSLRSVHPFFAQLTLYQTPKSDTLQCFYAAKRAPSCGGIYMPSPQVICSPNPTTLVYSQFGNICGFWLSKTDTMQQSRWNLAEKSIPQVQSCVPDLPLIG